MAVVAKGISFREFERRTILRIGLVKQRVGLELFRRIVLKTPVDTGWARSSWHVALGAPNTSVPPPPSAKGGGALLTAVPTTTALAGPVPVGVPVYVTSSLAYIKALEQGHSRQAPQGMVAVSIQEVLTGMRGYITRVKNSVPPGSLG